MPRPSPLQAHPWHGIPAGEQAPDIVNVFIELVPTDTVKYEVDKPSGHLKLDRPQQFSNLCPAPYGFVPRTWCRSRVAALAMEATGRTGVIGDGDPVDICVLTERPINHGSILLRAKPIGGLRLFDRHEADDKLVGVLVNDPAFGDYTELARSLGLHASRVTQPAEIVPAIQSSVAAVKGGRPALIEFITSKEIALSMA